MTCSFQLHCLRAAQADCATLTRSGQSDWGSGRAMVSRKAIIISVVTVVAPLKVIGFA